MTADEFRALALALPGAVEKSHMGHPDFRVGERIFATLGPRDTWGVVKLPIPDQMALVAMDGETFEPSAGAWGAKGWTKVRLAAAEASVVGRALEAAWREMAAGPARPTRKKKSRAKSA
jgi:hypothetical protein